MGLKTGEKEKIEKRLVKIYVNKCQLPQKGLGHEMPEIYKQNKHLPGSFSKKNSESFHLSQNKTAL